MKKMSYFKIFLDSGVRHRYSVLRKEGRTLSKGNPRITLRLEPDAMSEITKQAEALGVSVSVFVRAIIYAYLEVHS